MFDKNIYVGRRQKLRRQVGSGLILLLGNGDAAMNYLANVYPFRQDSSFLYFVGIDIPGLAAVLDCDENRDILFGNDPAIDDIVWMGPQPPLRKTALQVGIREQLPLDRLEETLQKALLQGRRIHYLPAYRGDRALWLERLLGVRAAAAKNHASRELIQAVVDQRAVKNAEEVMEIDAALAVTASMYEEARRMAKPGLRENEIASKLEGTALEAGRRLAFPAIVTIRGETLHNQPTANRLKRGDLLLIDSGTESPGHYAADITRTLPVGGKFSARQKEIYETVLAMQQAAIAAIRPGLAYKKVHLLAATILVQNLKAIGLMKGDPGEAVAAGSHALFFPHGLGHMLGLDVHDMEDLGENYVGYDARNERSKQFGLAYLRLARELQPGFVITVEPGIYFIPALIAQWKSEKKHAAFINYERLEAYKGFGGIRVEDDVLVTARGHRVLGLPIPKQIPEIES